ncbi:DUF6134 family protein [Acidiphilium sp. PA]|uniref:DUF6134 family protein n=1 Tax=Acidiphilium sp. PA TaxID=2871705 RepID=UPI0022434261|nr:DUF6134 family protein [Acidiphilium sp. PA]MCW8305719.1 DUF6134 family protein [Acidiphilium sp. PA]
MQPSIDRRSFIAMAAAVAIPLPQGNRLSFDVFRNGSKVGEQHLRFIDAGDMLTVDNHVELKVGLLAIPLFRYTAHIVEHWRDEQFVSATSAINDNGTPYQLFVERQSSGVVIQGNRTPRYVAPANALPLTYWNKAMLRGPMINMQTGHTDTPRIAKLGWFKLPALPSGTVTAEQYKLTGPIRLSVYYDQKNIWSSLAFDHKGHITYKPVRG